MSLTVSLVVMRECDVFWENITHNLTEMANKLGIYKMLWRPEEVGIEKAHQLIGPLGDAIVLLENDKDGFFDQFNPPNGWGDKAGFLNFLKTLQRACIEEPEARYRARR